MGGWVIWLIFLLFCLVLQVLIFINRFYNNKNEWKKERGQVSKQERKKHTNQNESRKNSVNKDNLVWPHLVSREKSFQFWKFWLLLLLLLLLILMLLLLMLLLLLLQLMMVVVVLLFVAAVTATSGCWQVGFSRCSPFRSDLQAIIIYLFDAVEKWEGRDGAGGGRGGDEAGESER